MHEFWRGIESQYVVIVHDRRDNYFVFNISFSPGINWLLCYKLNHSYNHRNMYIGYTDL